MGKHKGLGDSIEAFTKFTGIKWLAKKILGEDCGCDERQEKLNKLVPYKQTKEDTIFVQIAAYRDPQLIPTLKDLLKNSKHPENLRICIAWQHSEEDKWDVMPKKFLNDKRFNILDIPYTEAEGVCWARNQIQQHYKGEKYTLQIDSHHRFIPNWDEELLTMYKQLQDKGVPKPLLTSYLPSFFPEGNKEVSPRTQEVWQMDFNRYTPEGYIFTFPSLIKGWKNMTEPLPARFYSAHFAFTTGKFAKEVQHDPEMYFHGEEPSIAARAFTHGYDLYHPHKIIAWHEYTRDKGKRHWDDNDNWGERDAKSHHRYRLMHEMDGETCTPCAKRSLGKYYFGKKRTLEEYEKYAGLRFRDRKVQQYTLDLKPAPNPLIKGKKNYETSLLSHFKHCLDVWDEHFKHDDYEYWVVAFEKDDGTQLSRNDVDKEEIENLLNEAKEGDNFVRIWREYVGEYPDKYVIWPYSKSKGWVDEERIEERI
tara:strand:+ start:1000 stop:2433 length:1434 start_codon:yes stop_codon:yes gene_type:complete